MGIIHLTIELTFDLIALTLGIILILRAKDNYPKLWWGIIAASIGFMFTWENVGWLMIITHTPTYRFTNLLDMEKMLKWYALAGIIPLFPLASLSPGYFNHSRILIFLLPSIIIITIGLSYLCFNGSITPIYSLDELPQNISSPDIRLRICIFLCTVLTPTFFLVYLMFHNSIYRKINHNMHLFCGFLFLFLVIYILFTLNINEFIFNLFGITAIVFTVIFSMLYLRHENPFSNHTSMLPNTEKREEKEREYVEFPQPLPLFSAIETYLKERHPYTDSHYAIDDLAKALDEKEHDISMAIKSNGFTGFREYINYLRLEHFKFLSIEQNDKNIKELMFACGFTSRATFYRNFSERYGVSPTKFVENQQVRKS